MLPKKFTGNQKQFSIFPHPYQIFCRIISNSSYISIPSTASWFQTSIVL